MIEPDGVLDGDHGETVAVWFGVGHGQSDYPDPIKATQPFNPIPGPDTHAYLALKSFENQDDPDPRPARSRPLRRGAISEVTWVSDRT